MQGRGQDIHTPLEILQIAGKTCKDMLPSHVESSATGILLNNHRPISYPNSGLSIIQGMAKSALQKSLMIEKEMDCFEVIGGQGAHHVLEV